jgi:hypothetical protein
MSPPPRRQFSGATEFDAVASCKLIGFKAEQYGTMLGEIKTYYKMTPGAMAG